jgi:hypothetical protein
VAVLHECLAQIRLPLSFPPEHFHFYSAQSSAAMCDFSRRKAAPGLVALYTPEVKSSSGLPSSAKETYTTTATNAKTHAKFVQQRATVGFAFIPFEWLNRRN